MAGESSALIRAGARRGRARQVRPRGFPVGLVCPLEDCVDLIAQLHELIGVFFHRGLLAEVPPTFLGYGHTPPRVVAGDAHYTPLLFGGVKPVEAPGRAASSQGGRSVAQSGNGKQRQEKPRNQKAEKEAAHRARAEDGQSADFHHAEVTAAPGKLAWRDAGHQVQSPAGTAYLECGGLPPLFAVPACRDVLQDRAIRKNRRLPGRALLAG
jgi:hypothetical protein